MVTTFNKLHAKFMRWLIQRDHAGKRLGIFREFLPRTMDGILQMEYVMEDSVAHNLQRPPSAISQGKLRNSDPHRKLIYGKTSTDLVKQYLKKPDSLSPKELAFLGEEATYQDRRRLELALDPNHPLLQTINEHFRVKTENGFDLVL